MTSFLRFIPLIFSLVFPLAAQADTNEEKPYEIIATLDQGPGNVAVGPTGRIIFSLHQMYAPEINMMELMPDGSTRPYPTEEWAKKPEEGSDIGTQAVLGVVIDQEGTFWFMDNASTPPRLVAWDMNEEKLKSVYPMSEDVYTPGKTFINDMAINLRDQTVYLADVMGEPSAGMIVLDLKTGETRSVLRGHESSLPEQDQTIIIEEREVLMKEGGEIVSPRIGMNPITIDHKNEYVYYGSMHGTAIYRVPVAALNDTSLSAEELGAKVERYGDKPVSDGISIDNAGNVYITDLTGYGIGVTKPDGTYERIIEDREFFIWPDSISAAPDGTMVGNINQLNRTATLNAGEDVSEPPFYLFSFKPLAEVTVGR